MEITRDLGCAELWQESLERSLARRGKRSRSSLELYRLRPARDLTRECMLESAAYSRLRRRAAQQRSGVPVAVGAGAVSTVALVAVALSSLLSSRPSGRGGHTRVVLAASRPNVKQIDSAPAFAAPAPAAKPKVQTPAQTRSVVRSALRRPAAAPAQAPAHLTASAAHASTAGSAPRTTSSSPAHTVRALSADVPARRELVANVRSAHSVAGRVSTTGHTAAAVARLRPHALGRHSRAGAGRAGTGRAEQVAREQVARERVARERVARATRDAILRGPDSRLSRRSTPPPPSPAR